MWDFKSASLVMFEHFLDDESVNAVVFYQQNINFFFHEFSRIGLSANLLRQDSLGCVKTRSFSRYFAE